MTTCTCSHDSDDHALEDIQFIDGAPEEEDCLRLGWRWKCGGMYGTMWYPIPCTCTNFTLVETEGHEI